MLDYIIDNPDDVTGYLVYADWLDEFTDEHDKAQFIRLQCSNKDQDIQMKLLLAHPEWYAPMSLHGSGFKYGFLVSVRIPVSWFVVDSDELTDLGWHLVKSYPLLQAINADITSIGVSGSSLLKLCKELYAKRNQNP